MQQHTTGCKCREYPCFSTRSASILFTGCPNLVLKVPHKSLRVQDGVQSITVCVQIQSSIGHSDYVKRDQALKGLIQPLAGEYGMHNGQAQGQQPSDPLATPLTPLATL